MNFKVGLCNNQIVLVEELNVVASNVRSLMWNKGLSQNQLAELAGIDKNTMSKIVNGISVRDSILAKVAKALNVSVEQLFYSDVKSEYGARGKEVWDQTLKDALRNFDELDDGADKLTAAVEIWKLVDRAIKEQRARKAGGAGRVAGNAKAEARGAE